MGSLTDREEMVDFGELLEPVSLVIGKDKLRL